MILKNDNKIIDFIIMFILDIIIGIRLMSLLARLLSKHHAGVRSVRSVRSVHKAQLELNGVFDIYVNIIASLDSGTKVTTKLPKLRSVYRLPLREVDLRLLKLYPRFDQFISIQFAIEHTRYNVVEYLNTFPEIINKKAKQEKQDKETKTIPKTKKTKAEKKAEKIAASKTTINKSITPNEKKLMAKSLSRPLPKRAISQLSTLPTLTRPFTTFTPFIPQPSYITRPSGVAHNYKLAPNSVLKIHVHGS